MEGFLSFEKYQAEARKTAIYPGRGTVMGLVYAALGLGEAGEVQNKVKKILRDASGVLTDETRVKIRGELGDILWYISAMCDELGVSMTDVGLENLAKLADRQARGKLQGEGDRR